MRLSQLPKPRTAPIVADSDMSTMVGSPVHVSPLMVVDSGSGIQCLFDRDAVGDDILVGRYTGSLRKPSAEAGQDHIHSRGHDRLGQ